eukprot:UN34900
MHKKMDNMWVQRCQEILQERRKSRQHWDILLTLLTDQKLSCIINEYLHWYEYFTTFPKAYVCKDEIVIVTFINKTEDKITKILPDLSLTDLAGLKSRGSYFDLDLNKCTKWKNDGILQDKLSDLYDEVRRCSKVYILYRNDTHGPLCVKGEKNGRLQKTYDQIAEELHDNIIRIVDPGEVNRKVHKLTAQLIKLRKEMSYIVNDHNKKSLQKRAERLKKQVELDDVLKKCKQMECPG